jgi:hypothetical protein
MRYVAIRCIVALITFFIGVATTTIWFAYGQLLARLTQIEDVNYMKSIVVVPPVVFKKVETIYSTGIERCVTTHVYASSDDFRVYLTSDSYESPRLADHELQRIVESAVEIIEQGPVLNHEGRVVGERVVGRRNYGTLYNESAFIVWTYESRYNVVKGSSLMHVLAFEKAYRG